MITWVYSEAERPKGEITKHTIASAHFEESRSISVYAPVGYDPKAKAYGMLIVFRRERLPQSAAGSDGRDPRQPDRCRPHSSAGCRVGRQSQPGSARPRASLQSDFAEFLHSELVPWVREKWNVTRDPHQVTVGGSSYGGLASAWAAFVTRRRSATCCRNRAPTGGAHAAIRRGPTKMEEGVESGWLTRSTWIPKNSTFGSISTPDYLRST